MNINQLYEDLQAFIFEFGPKILGAIVVWIIGSWIIKLAVKALKKIFERTKLDKSLKPFILSLSGITMKLLLAISVLGMLGVEMTSFIAILGAAGLAIGMALSGTLQNFAGGVMILVFKPFKVDDLIDTQGHIGVVKEIQIFVTVLLTPENKTVILPNGAVANG
jgi:small conductance mechanosensitive channel